ncbi:MAG: molybdopterin-dependent oxidoreductase [bacterium]|nr:molybdopterin-dependent oxidoreductase [bacterium]
MKTFCRLCEVNCGLEATVDETGRLASLRPDRDHPISKGFACHKGLLAREIHHDPDRANHPQRKTGAGFERASWDEAIDDIAARLRAIVDTHGPESVALYIGNPSAFNALGSLSAGMFAAAIGTPHLFNAGTQDCSNKFAVSEVLYGSAEIHPIADLDHADHLLLIGTNPRVSKLSFLQTADPVGSLREVRDRGARVVFVNPLALEDLADVGETIQIRPDTDAYLLAAMLNEIEGAADLGFDENALEHVSGVDTLRAFVRRYPAERVTAIVGVDAERLRAMARDFATAPRAGIHVSTGVNMGRQGALAYYLAQMLALVTGNLDREGGNIFAGRGLAPMVMPPEVSAPRSTPFGDYVPARGTPPGALLADMIRDPGNPIRAFISIAGNPALSIGGGEDLSAALESLDLLVTLDFYRNATGELADWVLPAADWFEREDLNFFVQGVQREPYLQWTDAVVPPQAERRTDAWIFSRLLQGLGLPSLLDLPGNDMLSAVWDGRLAESGHSIAALREAEGHVVRIPRREPGTFLRELRGDASFDCCPPLLEAILDRAEPIFASLVDEDAATLKLITRRTNTMLNSGFQNVKALREMQGAATNPLYMHPRDALERGLRDGQFVVVRNEHGEVRTELTLDEKLREGVVAMTHGFGNQRTSGMPVAQSMPGVNVNVLSPVGPGSFDPLGGMSWLTGIQVEVEAV